MVTVVGFVMREIPVHVVRSGNDRVAGIVDAADDRLLPAKEDEALVLVNRTADGAAELIALERIFRVGKVVAGIEGPVAHKLERIAVPLVGARLGDDVHHRAGIVAILRVKAVGLDAELLQRVGEGEGKVDVAHQVFVVAAVQVVADLIRPGAVNCDRFLAGNLLGVALQRAGVVGDCRYGARNQKRQVGGVSAVQRQCRPRANAQSPG